MLDEQRIEELLDAMRGIRQELKRLADAVDDMTKVNEETRYPYGNPWDESWMVEVGDGEEEGQNSSQVSGTA